MPDVLDTCLVTDNTSVMPDLLRLVTDIQRTTYDLWLRLNKMYSDGNRLTVAASG